MRWLTVAALLLAVTLGCVPSAGAQSFRPIQRPSEHTIKFTYWPTSATASQAGAASWSTTMWVIDYRFNLPESAWGFQAQYAFGSQGSWGGASSAATSGNDSIWSADAVYSWAVGNALVNGFIGYGSIQWQTTIPAGNQRFTSSGPRIGFDALIPLRIFADRSSLSFAAALAWYPSNSTTFVNGGATTTGTGSARDWTFGLRYKFASDRHAETTNPGYQQAALAEGDEGPQGPASFINGTSWSAIIGWRSIDTGSGWSGVFLTIGKTF